LSWETTKAILSMRANRDGNAKERLDRCFASYFRLRPKMARTALQFYRLRQRADQSASH
jgi:hypothetical protein